MFQEPSSVITRRAELDMGWAHSGSWGAVRRHTVKNRDSGTPVPGSQESCEVCEHVGTGRLFPEAWVGWLGLESRDK